MITNTTDILFSYHAPNERTTPKYAAIRSAEAAFQRLLDALPTAFEHDDVSISIYYRQVNAGTAALYELLQRRFGLALPDPELHVPERHLHALDQHARASIALARNAANEAIATRQDVPRLLALARTEAQKARWAMCGIVAIVDAATHP